MHHGRAVRHDRAWRQEERLDHVRADAPETIDVRHECRVVENFADEVRMCRREHGRYLDRKHDHGAYRLGDTGDFLADVVLDALVADIEGRLFRCEEIVDDALDMLRRRGYFAVHPRPRPRDDLDLLDFLFPQILGEGDERGAARRRLGQEERAPQHFRNRLHAHDIPDPLRIFARHFGETRRLEEAHVAAEVGGLTSRGYHDRDPVTVARGDLAQRIGNPGD